MASEPHQSESNQKACWDEGNTAKFLQVLIDEINMGNRPAGHFSRTTWARICKEFASLSGDNYTVIQLKNKYDNMKKEFGMWEKLLHEETGLGYDHETGRITADPIWWKNKIKAKPEYKRFRFSGPTHLEMQEQVFRGMVATGYMKYVPAKYTSNAAGIGPQINDRGTSPTHNRNDPVVRLDYSDASTTAPVEALPIQTPDGKNKRQRKRKRSSTPGSKPTQTDVHQNLIEYINIMKVSEQSVNDAANKHAGSTIDYPTSITMLRSLTWLDPEEPMFIRAVALLEDPMKRQALASLIDLREEVIRSYLQLWIDQKFK